MINITRQNDEQFAGASVSKSQEKLKRRETERQFCQWNEYNIVLHMYASHIL